MLLFYLSLLDTADQEILLTHIYVEYKALMKHIALSILHNEDLAEEAVHDAMLKIIDWVKSHPETDPQKVKSFVCIVAKRTALNNLKYEQRRRTVSLEDLAIEPAVWDNYEEIDRADVISAINQLPYKYQEILQLAAQHELSIKEIAKILNLSQANTRKRLQRARKAIYKKWREQNANEN